MNGVPAWLEGVGRLFLDTAPVIYHVEGNPAYAEIMAAVMGLLDDGAIAAVTSPVTLAECLVVPLRQGLTELADAFRDVILNESRTTLVAVGPEVAERAADLRARYNLSLVDAFQVAAALVGHCDAFLTNDARLTRVTELRVVVLSDVC